MSTTAADTRAVCETCQAIYHPRQHGQRYCSRPCTDTARRVTRICQSDGCDAPARRHSAKHCQPCADEAAQQRAAEIALRRRKAWLPQPKAPTEAQVSCYLRNRDRDLRRT